MIHWKLTCIFSLFLCITPFYSLYAFGNKDFPSSTDYNHFYFEGLQAKLNENTKDAIENFKQGIKKTSPLCKHLCLKELIQLGTDKQQYEAAILFLELFPDNFLAASKVAEFLYKETKYQAVLNIKTSETPHIENTSSYQSNDISYKNEFLYYQFLSAAKLGSISTEKIEKWFSSSSVSQWHIKFYDEWKELLLYKSTGTTSFPLIDGYVLLAKQFYDLSAKNFSAHLSSPNRQKSFLDLPENFFSSYGKALLYGSSNFLSAASEFEQYSAFLNLNFDNELTNLHLFYIYFYTARFYEKLGFSFYQEAENNFLLAMQIAPESSNYDNALWYYLSLQLKKSTTSAIKALNKYANTWHSPSYFSDFLSDLAKEALSNRQYNEFYTVTQIISDFSTPDDKARFSYVSARLLQEKLITKVNKNERNEQIQKFMEEAWQNDTAAYYKLLSGLYLGKTEKDLFLHPSSPSEANITEDLFWESSDKNEIDSIFDGYIQYSLTQYIYPFYLQYSEFISSTVAFSAVNELQNAGEFSTALRLSVAIFKQILQQDPNYIFQMSQLKLLWPIHFDEFVTYFCTEYEMPEDLIFSVIRSESFFQPDVVSHAGANGLMQLMDATAGDIARKLKTTDYSLINPETNIKFGIFYLAELTQRLDGNIFAAVLSYNTGITRIRNWMKLSTLPADLFLETVPFDETRGYGIKVFSATAMYGMLYYGRTLKEIAQEFDLI